MTHWKALEAVDRSLRDLRQKKDTPMSGILLVLAGDFRQTLPVIPGGTPADEMNANLQKSVLWRVLQKLSLTTNMRA